MTYLNDCIFQCEQIFNQDNMLVFNDEFENSFFDRLYVSLLEKTPKIEQLGSELKLQYYFEEEELSSTAKNQSNEILDRFKISKKSYLNIKNYLDEPLFLKQQLLQIFTNLLVFQHSNHNFRKKSKSQLKCLFSLMILNIEYKKHFSYDKINKTKCLVTKFEQNNNKNFLDLIYQWIEVYADFDAFKIDTKFMENFSFEFFDFDDLTSFFKNPKNTATILSLCLFNFMNKHVNFVDLLHKKTIINTFNDDRIDVRSILKENSDFAIEFYSIVIVNVLFNESFLDKIQINLETNQNDSMEKELPNKKYSIIQSLIEAKFIDSHILSANFSKVFENIFELSYYLSMDGLFITKSLDIDYEFFFESNFF